jgi:AcrR family transcriptional regulator
MPRPGQLHQQRKRLLPIVTQAFSDLGYRRATTAELARRCGVRENILYRLWPDKKAMFLAAIDDIFASRAAAWQEVLGKEPDAAKIADRLVAYESQHQGEFGFYRVVFTALAETDDPDIRAALVRMYRGFFDLVGNQLRTARRTATARRRLAQDPAAWALIGLAAVSNIIRHLELLSSREREQMFSAVARYLVEGAA